MRSEGQAFRRHIPAELRTALELGTPPDLDGATCLEERCGRRPCLERDHDDPRAHRGPTTYDNLKPRCRPTTATKPNGTAKPAYSSDETPLMGP